MTLILAYSWEACGTCGPSYCYCLWICGTCGSPLEFVRTFLVRPSFAFSFLWPPSRGFMLGFCRNPGYATSFSAIFSAFSSFFFPFFGFLLPSCPFFSTSFFICFFPQLGFGPFGVFGSLAFCAYFLLWKSRKSSLYIYMVGG